MERMEQKRQYVEKALARLSESLALHFNAISRDSSLLRFQLSFEAMWKYAQIYLRMHEGLEENSPKGVIRACLQIHVLTAEEAEMALEMADDRNLTVHTYDEVLANELYSHLPNYLKLFNSWLKKLSVKSS